MKRISLDDLLHTRQDLDYQEQYEYIMKLLEKGQIKPVKASKSNGKKPALYREYWMVEEQKDYSNYIEETPLYNFLVLKQKHCVLLNKKMPYRSFRCIMSLSKKTL